jgi:peroxiredoxin
LEKTRDSFEKINTRVLAINPASVESHRKFCAQKKFNFPILSDPGENVLSQFKAQKNSGRGVIRTVYGIDRQGIIVSAKRGLGDFKKLLKLFAERAH